MVVTLLWPEYPVLLACRLPIVLDYGLEISKRGGPVQRYSGRPRGPCDLCVDPPICIIGPRYVYA